MGVQKTVAIWMNYTLIPLMQRVYTVLEKYTVPTGRESQKRERVYA